ncbi:P-loop containing nucleoside triphosphate hydrolase protein [Athelia psychrophila]|uniref:P-loop containing nucleoside triphosphate hydrolase protein n=1 Tax=Athelia psychrophila TaxID=1759441 RepID=A0A166NND9_9AGAM|nr:P-loop containing nucleoside triphosphate hydrolase protein [Fibularhizoctonia sp. CBS 109695]
MSESCSFQPSVFKMIHLTHLNVHVVTIYEHQLTTQRHILEAFIDTVDGVVGLAPIYGSGCVLTTLAMASSTSCLVIKFPKKPTKLNPGRILLQDLVLCQSDIQKSAFRMDRLAVSLFLDRHIRITGAVDLLSTGIDDRNSLASILSALGGEITLQKDNVKKIFKRRETALTSIPEVAEQAWAACHTSCLPSMSKRMLTAARIDTQALQSTHLSFFAKTFRDADRMDALKPTTVKNDITGDFTQKSGVLQLTSDRFKTRIMETSHTQASSKIHVVASHQGNKLAPVMGRAKKVEGRTAQITLRGSLQGSEIDAIYTIGKDDPTNAEGQRAAIILEGLKQTNMIVKKLFVQSIWLPGETSVWPPRPPMQKTPINFSYRTLNPSQRDAVAEILSNTNPISLIQGPPGTGKTSVIAASVTSMMAVASDRTIWLIAASNVAVKNIAEKLAEVDFLEFSLVVSTDFHFDWHEHLYEKIRPRVIESENIPKDVMAAERLLLGSRVILCTISMLTNSRSSPITHVVPVECIIVDEASQIEIGQYLPMLSQFGTSLKKLVFIGDDKQLAPYGQDDIGNLRSIFEVDHLRRKVIFLNTQYRMPVPIGAFISRHVYEGKLRTQHDITVSSSCRFKDVPNGEELLVGCSWANQKEVIAVMAIALQYHNSRKTYRIITRALVERALTVDSNNPSMQRTMLSETSWRRH